MKVNDRVLVTKQGLMSTGWSGDVIEVVGNKATVRFIKHGRERVLTYNFASLAVQKGVKKAVNKADKNPAIPDDMFEIIEQRKLHLTRNGNYCFVYKNRAGDRQYARCYINTEQHIDNDKGTIELGLGNPIKFEDIIYLIYVGTQLKFKRPKDNEFPFYIFDDNTELMFRGFMPKDATNPDYELLEMGGGNMMLTKWLVNIKDIQPDVRVVQERKLKAGAPINQDIVHQLAEEQLKADQETATRDKNCFGVVFRKMDDGEVKVKSFFGRPCHAMMSSAGHNFPKDKWIAEFAVQYICRVLGRYNHSREYLTWVMNESPWAQYCITKDYEEALVTGIKVRVDIPSNAMMCTFYALRYPTEYPEKINKWKNYCDAGMNKSAAFFAAETNLIAGDTSGHHQLLDTHAMNLQDFVDFCNNREGKIKEPTYRDKRSYRNVSVHHGSKNGNYRGDTAVRKLREMDIFGNGQQAAGAFGGGGGREVDLAKFIAVTNELINKG